MLPYRGLYTLVREFGFFRIGETISRKGTNLRSYCHAINPRALKLQAQFADMPNQAVFRDRLILPFLEPWGKHK